MEATSNILSPDTSSDYAARVDALLRSEPTPMIKAAIAAFRRELPSFVDVRRGSWVAYHGGQQIAFGRTQTQLYELCRQRGLDLDEILVCGVEESVFNPDEDYVAAKDV